MTSLIEDSAEIGLRERKKQQTRNAIHEAALHLIDEQGLEATTIEQICQDADVSTRTFFNYFPSKAAAALEIAGTTIDPEIRDRFRGATGTLVAALCDAVGSTAELGPSHLRMKQLILRRPELLTILSQMMVEVRGQYIALASERAATSEQAELAVSLVMSALGRVMHDDNSSDAPLATRLRETVDLLVGVSGAPLAPLGIVESDYTVESD
jgi:AcrR family transcriptional regulator